LLRVIAVRSARSRRQHGVPVPARLAHAADGNGGNDGSA